MARKSTKQEFVGKLISKGRTDLVLLGDYTDSKTKTLFKCTKDGCGHEWYTTPDGILQGNGCPVCAGQKVASNINSLAVKRPDLLIYFENKEDAYKITSHSNKYVDLICPDCGTRKRMTANMLSQRGFSCSVCSDFISYPNKFLRSLLIQLESEIDSYCFEWYPVWGEGRIYDAYFVKNGIEYTVEMQGEQHYGLGWNKNIYIEDMVAIDNLKSDLSIKHSVIPIIIDARFSQPEFIFNNIKNSLFADIFDLLKVDVDKCDAYALSNIIKHVCNEYKNNKDITIIQLSEKFKVDRNTITNYLKRGNRIGWCEYNPEQSIALRIQRMSKAINVFDENKKLVYSYSSISECCRELSRKYNCNYAYTSIKRRCDGFNKPYKGLLFEYA